MNLITPQEAWRRHRHEHIALIDVRTPKEYRSLHAEGARNHELGQLSPAAIENMDIGGDKSRQIILICKTGSRAKSAARKFEAIGFGQVCVVDGGTDSWLEADLPVVTGKKSLSLERQVRIVAGSLVLVGTLLSVLVASAFWVIPAFIGVGLIFAGITDICGMGLLLAKMPWNR